VRPDTPPGARGRGGLAGVLCGGASGRARGWGGGAGGEGAAPAGGEGGGGRACQKGRGGGGRPGPGRGGAGAGRGSRGAGRKGGQGGGRRGRGRGAWWWGVVRAADVPGDPLLATFVHDEPIFAVDTVEHIGQVIGLVVANSVMQARHAARKVQLHIDALPAVLTVREALAAQSFVLPPVTVRRGDAAAALARAPHTLSGSLEVGGQEHFYLEGQIAYVLPQEQNQWLVYSSTQHPGEAQHWVSHALGIDNNAVRVECRRMGGGFGGKETQSGHMAVWAALAARKFGKPVKLRMDRDDDFMVTGKRHPFAYDYTAGFDERGRLCGLQLMMAANCGFSADLSGPVADRAIFHADNAYFLEDVSITSYRCKTNTQSHTAFRGFGGPQGMIVIESVMGDIARRGGAGSAGGAPGQLLSRDGGGGCLRRGYLYQSERGADDAVSHAS